MATTIAAITTHHLRIIATYFRLAIIPSAQKNGSMRFTQFSLGGTNVGD
jgi:hypothetical protein